VKEFARAGVAAIQLEDQSFPKVCGHLDDKQVVSIEDFVSKIRAAVRAKEDPDFIIIARSDARAPLGLDEAIRRVNAALDAGADIAFVEAPQSVAELEAIPRLVKGPCLLNLVHGGKTPDIDLQHAERMGYSIAIVPGLLMMSIVVACDQALAALKKNGAHPPLARDLSIHEFFRAVGADEWDRLRRAFGHSPK
jgi:2-methylisocitrate lyase-like PEP mutase family enzyme